MTSQIERKYKNKVSLFLLFFAFRVACVLFVEAVDIELFVEMIDSPDDDEELLSTIEFVASGRMKL